MKLSNLSVIFVIIVIPIILVLSYYISLQIDTINMQTAYRTKQLEATKEAIEAFEINTVEWNEAFSENADSKRRDIMASINTFTTSFANSLGIGGTNKENIEVYIPAIACTLYDGYYIYTPSEVKSVIKDENGVAVFVTEKLAKDGNPPTINFYGGYKDEYLGKLLYEYDSSIEGASADGTYKGTDFTLDAKYAKSTYEHILKPFSTYSARYKTGDGPNDIDITVNYTLDSYITIYGTVKGEYVSKSGYLILPQNDLNLSSERLTEQIAWRWNEDGTYTCQTYPYVYAEDNTKVYFDGDTTFQVSSTGIRTDLNNTTEVKYKKIRKSSWEPTYQALNTGSVKIINNAGEPEIVTIEQGKLYKDKKGTEDTNIGEDIPIEVDYSSRNYYIESTDFTEWVKDNLADITIGDMQNVEDTSIYGNPTDKMFDLEGIDPESEDSLINLHKREVIKQTLISNLNQSITSYSRNSEGEYRLPVLTETDWDHILRNVSIITFVQGMPIGMKYYNNYVIATSTQNKEYVIPDEIYLSTKSYTDGYYHMPYCEKLNIDEDDLIGYRNIDYVIKSYQGKEADGTKYTNYYFRHSSIADEACYYCLVQRDLFNDEDLSNNEYEAHDKAYKIALARERYRNISEINLIDRLEDTIVVTLDANGGTVSPGTINVALGGTYGDPIIPRPMRVGYDFAWWWTKKEEGEGTHIADNTEVINPNDHTIYAHWEPGKYIVSFDSNEGTTPSIESKEVTYGQAYGDLATTSRIGYTFDGWHTLPSGASEVREDTIVSIGSNHTLYAHWTPNKYIVSFDSNGGGTPNPRSQTVTYGQNYGTLAKVSRTGYTFDGWWTSATGGTRIEPTTLVQITGNQTLYAHWTPNKYTVTFNSNGGGTPNPRSQTVTYGQNYGQLATVSRGGYDFAGWYTSANGGTKIEPTTLVQITGNQTLYAHWSPKTIYLYNSGNEYTDITGGWYPTIYSDWKEDNNYHKGAFYSKSTNSLIMGDDSDEDYGNGAFATWGKIDEISDYNKLCIEFKIEESSGNTSNNNRVEAVLTRDKPIFVEYNVRLTPTFKIRNDTTGNFTQKTLQQLKTDFNGSTIHGKAKTIKYGTAQHTTGATTTKTIITLTDNDKSIIRQNGGCYIILNSFSHYTRNDTIKVSVSKVYLTNQ